MNKTEQLPYRHHRLLGYSHLGFFRIFKLSTKISSRPSTIWVKFILFIYLPHYFFSFNSNELSYLSLPKYICYLSVSLTFFSSLSSFLKWPPHFLPMSILTYFKDPDFRYHFFHETLWFLMKFQLVRFLKKEPTYHQMKWLILD